MKWSSAAGSAALLSLASTSNAAIATKQISNGISYALNIPQSTASSGNGDIFFQITAPTSFSWVALGQGSRMSGSHIFVLYTSSDGNNVTISPRLGTGHVMPQFDSSTSLTLLDGSGVSNGVMTANVKCSNCNSWNGGSMDFTSTGSSNWIYAYKSGSPLNSDDTSESISQHDDSGLSFTWNLASAQGGSDTNPFVAAAPAASSTTSATSTATAASTSATDSAAATTTTTNPTSTTSTSASSTPTCPAGYHYANNACQITHGPPDASSDSDPFNGDAALGNRIKIIHGTLASLAFIALFPTGAILIRIASFTGAIWVHTALQITAWIIYIVAFGMGAYLMSQIGSTLDSHAHPALGGLIFLVLLSQPITGWVHHRVFVRHGARSGWSYAHLYIGRAAILLGMVNGGLGIALVGNVSMGGKVAYAVFAAIMGIAYIAAIVVGEMRRKKALQGRTDAMRMADLAADGQQREVEGVVEYFPKSTPA